MLIDAHVHLNEYHGGDPTPLPQQVEGLWQKMEQRGVDHAVVITSYKVDDHRPSVEKVLDTLCEDPRTSVVEGLRWKGKERTDLDAVEQRIRAGRVKGIKVYPGYEPMAINDPSLEPVFAMAGDLGVPVLFHTGDTYAKHAKVRHAHPLLVDDVAVDFPDTRFVMCHAGNPWFTDAAQVIYKNDNVYADISGLTLGTFTSGFEDFMRRRLSEMITYMGAAERRLMYGTDWPLVEMGPYIDFLDSLDVDDEARECLRWRTACDVYGINPDLAKNRPSPIV